MGKKMAGTNEFAFFRCKSICTGGVQNQAEKNSKNALFLYSGGTDSLENFTAEFSASAPVVYKNPPPMGPEILYTTGAGEGVKVSVAIFPSSGGGV